MQVVATMGEEGKSLSDYSDKRARFEAVQADNGTHINSLPLELLLSIFGFFPFGSLTLARIMRVCKHWNRLANDTSLITECRLGKRLPSLRPLLPQRIYEHIVAHPHAIRSLWYSPDVTNQPLIPSLISSRLRFFHLDISLRDCTQKLIDMINNHLPTTSHMTLTCIVDDLESRVNPHTLPTQLSLLSHLLHIPALTYLTIVLDPLYAELWRMISPPTDVVFSSVGYFNVTYARLNQSVVESIACVTKLQSLELVGFYLEDFRPLTKLARLETLKLNSYLEGEAHLNELLATNHVTTLVLDQKISFGHFNLTAANSIFVGVTSLEELSIRIFDEHDDSSGFLDRLSSMPRLTSLSLIARSIQCCFTVLEALPRLERLRLTCWPPTIPLFSSLARCISLEKFTFSTRGLGYDSEHRVDIFPPLAALLESPSLKEIDITNKSGFGHGYNAAGFSRALSANTTLEALHINDPSLGYIIDDLASALNTKPPHFKFVTYDSSIGGGQVTDEFKALTVEAACTIVVVDDDH